MIDIDNIADRLTRRLEYLKKNWILIILFGIPIIILFAYFFVKTSFVLDNYYYKDIKNYSRVEYSDSVFGVIDSVYSYRGLPMITLKNSSKIWFPFSENKEYKKYLLCDFLQKNDSLNKQRNSDTLFVYRIGKRFYFLFDGLKTSITHK